MHVCFQRAQHAEAVATGAAAGVEHGRRLLAAASSDELAGSTVYVLASTGTSFESQASCCACRGDLQAVATLAGAFE